MSGDHDRMVLEAQNTLITLSTVLALPGIDGWEDAVNSLALLWDRPYMLMEEQIMASMAWSRQFAPDDMNDKQKACFDYILYWHQLHFDEEMATEDIDEFDEDDEEF